MTLSPARQTKPLSHSLQQVDPLAYNISQTGRRLNCSRPRVYELIRQGELVSFKDGRHQKVPAYSINDYIARKIVAAAAARERVA